MWSLFIVFFSIASLVLTRRAIGGRTWHLMLVAAFCSTVVSLVTGLSIGVGIFFFTCLQLAAATALRWQLPAHGWLVTLVLAVVVWIVVVPVQVHTGVGIGGLAFLLIPTIVALALVVGPARAASLMTRRTNSDH